MSRKCSAPFCGVDDRAGIFKLFEFPCKEELRDQWQARMKVPFLTGPKLEDKGRTLYLCEVHFDDKCWYRGHREKELLENAIPLIFQHNLPLEYLSCVYEQLISSQLIPEEGNRIMMVVDQIRAEGTVEDIQVKDELIQCGTLLVSCALQNAQISQTSDLIQSTRTENEALSIKIQNLEDSLKSTE